MTKQAERARRALSVLGALLIGGGTWTAVAAASPGPSVTTFAGNGTRGSSGDGGPAVAAELNAPTGLAEDLVGTLYFADTANNRVRKIVLPTTIHTDIVSTIAGTGVPGSGGDGGLATSAGLRRPTGLAVDGHGDVFIADSGNNRIREINASGVISTFAGTGACGRGIRLGNDRPATKASLCDPTGIALDRAGDLFIADTRHNVVREVRATGTIVPFAGIGRGGWNGNRRPAGQAMLDDPTGVAIDALGNVYIADTGNQRIRGVFNGPPPVLPEIGMAILFPVSVVLIAGGGMVVVRRRRRYLATSGR